MKQTNLFGEDYEKKIDSEYTTVIKIPSYEPKTEKPQLIELYDDRKYNLIINEINMSNISDDDKKILKIAATRHIRFNYEKIADYYANSNKEVQKLMERQALVIIDFNKAYTFGYIKLANEMANQFFNIYGDDK